MERVLYMFGRTGLWFKLDRMFVFLLGSYILAFDENSILKYHIYRDRLEIS